MTNEIYRLTGEIKNFRKVAGINVDISTIGTQTYEIEGVPFTVEVIDSVHDYLELMQSIFDFSSLKSLLQGSKFKILIDAMHGVTGPYVEQIFVKELGASPESVHRTTPLPDFGGHHPDPNLTYAKDLVDRIAAGDQHFGAAFDGDGDRNMILGEKAFFVNPSDSLAVIADNLSVIPYFKKRGLRGFARSMPTGAAVDRYKFPSSKKDQN